MAISGRKGLVLGAVGVVLVAAVGIFLATRPPSVVFKVTSTLFHSRAFLVRAATDTTQVLAGDRFFMDVEGTTPFYAYVLNEDDLGDLYILFPVEGLDLKNPLSPGERHRLPGNFEGQNQDWVVPGTSKTEKILLLGTEKPIRVLEDELAEFSARDDNPDVLYAPLESESLSGVRKGLGLGEAKEGSAPGERLVDLDRDLKGPGHEGVFIRLMRLQLEPAKRDSS